MLILRKTAVYDSWFRNLRDHNARARIETRIDRLLLGNPGDVRLVGEGVSELRIHYGPGYRVYFISEGETLVILLCGGDKSGQAEDVARAKALARDWEN